LTKSKEDMMRDFILNCSEALFTQYGYKNTSMEKIAEKCEISKPTLYNYFASKSSLFIGLFSRFQIEMNDKGKALMGQTDKDKYLIIEEIIDISLAFMKEKCDFLKMMVREHHMVIHENENIEEHMNFELRRRQEVSRSLGEFMKEIVRSEILEEFDVDMIGWALSNLLEGALWGAIKDDFTDYKKQKQLIMKLLKKGILI
jgi:AcrR family transcriptional regulator